MRMEQIRKPKKQNVIILLCCACLYCLNRFWLKKAIQLPVVGYVLRCHFNDFLAGIAILAYINLIFSISKFSNFRIITFPNGICITFSCALLWEFILPWFFPHGVSDWLDILAYVFGGMLYIKISHSIQKV